MMVQYLTKTDVAAMLHVGRDAAAALLDSWGVPTINLGPGRGRGRRWDALDVERALAERRRRTGPVEPARPGRRKKPVVVELTAKERIAEILAKRGRASC